MRLFGGFGVPGATGHLINVLGEVSWQHRAIQQMSELYRRLGYWTEDVESLTLCPGHAANALAFMSHCLLLGDLGIREAADVATEFFERYLMDWMPRFGDALVLESAHPVTTLTGVAVSAFARAETLELVRGSALSAS
jgi:TorA maturation chaperone TorD